MAVFNLSLFEQRSRALIGLLSKVLTLLFLSLSALANPPSNCASTDLYARDQYVCAGDVVYAAKNSSSLRRSVGPFKVEGAGGTEVAVQDLKLRHHFNMSNIEFSFAKTKGCSTNKICVGDLVRASEYDDTLKVVGIYAASSARGELFVVSPCGSNTCATASEPYFNIESRELTVTKTISQDLAKSKRIDSQVLQELQDAFRSFDQLTMEQYLSLKRSKGAALLNAQRNLSEYLQSSVTELLPPPGQASDAQVRRAIDLRQKFFVSPVMIQTGFEILAHELLKSENEVRCSVVTNTLRFISLGSDPWGRATPGLDYTRNLLVVTHLYAAYVKDIVPNSLPCQTEINNQVMVKPELYEQYHEGCSPDDAGDCEIYRGTYMDAETRIGIIKMARAFNTGENYKFDGAMGRTDGGWFGKPGRIGRYKSEALMDSSKSLQRRRVGLLFTFDTPRARGAVLNSSVTFYKASTGFNAVTTYPELSSQQVMSLYRSLAAEFLQ